MADDVSDRRDLGQDGTVGTSVEYGSPDKSFALHFRVQVRPHVITSSSCYMRKHVVARAQACKRPR